MQRRIHFGNRRGIPQSLISLRPVLVTGGVAVLAATVLAGLNWPGDTPYRTVAGPGHGRGMSQHGAFENAQQGWTAEHILEHYYPGATLGAIPHATVGVRLMEQDDSSLDAYADAGFRVAGKVVAPGQVAHLTPLPDGGANVVVTVGCDGEVLWQSATRDPWVYPLDPNPGRPAAEHLKLCGGSAYRGSLGVASENGAARTVNRVDVEDYLLGVVPAEVQANWADKGAGEALRAQAIAARSYALAESRYPYAQTCDTTDCQVYPGTAEEDPRAAAAVAASAGTVLLRDGRILRSEYSAAPGGGEPADIYAFDVGPAPAELAIGRPPADPRTRAAIAESAIDVEYRRIGGEGSAVGAPLGPEMRLPQNAGTYRLFANGVIIATPTLGAQVVDFTTLMQLVPDSSALESGPAAGARQEIPSPGGTLAPTTASTPTPRPTPVRVVPSGEETEGVTPTDESGDAAMPVDGVAPPEAPLPAAGSTEGAP
ncbi:SpoIID/LytB domain-containing protein [Nocardia sp. NPDC050710]|uniref:SpoIID/LytB domain-containing protein n=1 Tax=Nocardia sp. NPDC050710 TaxID=3157220 RepID=UPI003407B629